MKLFISYPRKDREETDHLITLLKKAGHEVWIDDALIVGDGWEKQLHDAISEADALVLALTSNWVESPYCQWEFVTGVELGKGIIPVMLLQTDLPARIQKIQYADFTDGFDDEDHNEKFLNDLHTLSQKLVKNSDDEQARNQATVKIQQQIKQSNKQEATIGDVSGGTVMVTQSNVAQQTNTYGEKQRNWTIPVVLGLIIALITLFVTVFPSATESFLDNFAQPTAIAGEPFQEGVVGIVLADFSDLDAGAREVERRIEREFEDAEIPFIRVRHEITDREEAQRIADLYNATITIWGESADAWIEVFYEITPRTDIQVRTTIENSIVATDLENFSTYILEGMDTLYVVNFTMGQLEYFEQDYQSALPFFNQAIGAIPSGREDDLDADVLYFYRAVSHQKFENNELAIADYARAIELNPEFIVAYNNRGNAYVDMGETELAVADYGRAIELDPEFALAYNNRGVAYRSLGEHELAVADYGRAIELDPEYINAYNNRGVAYRSLGEHELAIADYDRVIELDPEYVDAYYNRGVAYRSLGETELAIVDYDRVIELDPEFALAYNNRGVAYYRLGETELALADYNRAIELDPQYFNAYIGRGLTYVRLGETELAIADYGRAIELDPEYRNAYNNRGAAYRSLGEHELAMADFDRAIELDSSYANAYWGRGNTHYDRGIDYYADAIADYRQYEILTGALEPFMVERIAEMEVALADNQ